MRIVAYLNFDGQCEEAFRFYEKVLGGTVDALHRHAGTPAEAHVPPEWKQKIMHAHLTVGEAELMASDVPPGRFEKAQGTTVSINVDDPKEADRIFTALSEGGTVTMPIGETFWAQRFGMCVDRFGIPWMVNCAPGQ